MSRCWPASSRGMSPTASRSFCAGFSRLTNFAEWLRTDCGVWALKLAGRAEADVPPSFGPVCATAAVVPIVTASVNSETTTAMETRRKLLRGMLDTPLCRLRATDAPAGVFQTNEKRTRRADAAPERVHPHFSRGGLLSAAPPALDPSPALCPLGRRFRTAYITGGGAMPRFSFVAI